MPSDFAAKVAKRIKDLREGRGLSLRQLAKKSGLAPESVSRSERGINEISLTNLDRLCHGLDVDLPTFFAFAKSAIPEGGVAVAQLAEIIACLPTGSRPGFVRAIESLVNALVESGRHPHQLRTRRGTRTTSVSPKSRA